MIRFFAKVAPTESELPWSEKSALTRNDKSLMTGRRSSANAIGYVVQDHHMLEDVWRCCFCVLVQYMSGESGLAAWPSWRARDFLLVSFTPWGGCASAH